MTPLDFGPALALIVPTAGSMIGWVYNRHAKTATTLSEHDKRLALTEQAFVDLKELINTRFDSLDQRVGRVERSLNGYLRHE